jgi:nitrate/nitrite transporter NarK
VPIAGLLARWFEPPERGVANGVYYGLGGGLGEGAAFLLLPVIGIYFLNRSDLATPDWRGAMIVKAVCIGAIGILCCLLLRSAPEAGLGLAASDPGPEARGLERRDRLSDPILWLLGLYFAAGIVALRLIPGWLTMYAADLLGCSGGMGRKLPGRPGG